MATIIAKEKKGRRYYYAIQSKRVNGKPRIIWQKYLGTIDAIINRADDARPQAPKEAVLFEAGAVAALLRIAQRLGVLEIINQIVPKREQGPSVGHYMLLAAINRATSPCSKLAIGDWYEQTVLRRLWGFDKKAFSAQRFWDHMDMISEQDIVAIQQLLCQRIKREFEITPDALLYDTTNFFTFLATTNTRCSLAQRGKSKQKRNDLRQVGLALLLSRDSQIPLFHKVYEGNITDVALFQQVAKEMIDFHHNTYGKNGQVIMTFDKGNVCDDGMEVLVVAQQPFIAAMPLNRLPEATLQPLECFENVPEMPGTKALTMETQLWGASCSAVLTYTESFFTQQLNGVIHNLTKCQKSLADLEKSLQKWRQGKARGKRPTVQGVKKSIAAILSAQFIKELMPVAVTDENGLPMITYEVDHDALEQLIRKRLGRTLLIAFNTQCETSEIIKTYRDLSQIEDAFKSMKNVDYLRWRPSYHWTTQKLKVHGLYCVVALLLTALARKKTTQAKIDLSMHALLSELSAIREVAVIYPRGTLAHRKDHVTLSRMSPKQRKIAEILEIGEALRG
jgi:transposase